MALGNITEVIKYEGANDVFIWKHPLEDFNTLTQLIVHQSQEAVFFMNGVALDLFGPGRHTLTTENLPLLRRIMNWATGERAVFHAEVYFINKTEQMALKWGTDSKVQFLEPASNLPIAIGASGEMSLRPKNSRQLLLKLVGTESLLGKDQLVQYFRAFLMNRVKSTLAQTIRTEGISIFEIDEHLATLSDALRRQLAVDFLDYGLSLERFFVTTVVKPDGDPAYERLKALYFSKYADVTEAQIRQQVGIIDQQTKAQQTIIEAEALSAKRKIEGYTYQQERGFEVAGDFARNEGAGTFASLGAGLGAAVGVGGALGGVVRNAMDGVLPGPAQPGAPAGSQPVPPLAVAPAFCQQCGAALVPGSGFCEECGAKTEPQNACPQCGFVFVRAGKFCPQCGTKR